MNIDSGSLKKFCSELGNFSHSQKDQDAHKKTSDQEENGSNIFISHEIVDGFVPEGVKDINNCCNYHEVNLILEVFSMKILKILIVMYQYQHQNRHGMGKIITKYKIV